jgi:hypothetical protein
MAAEQQEKAAKEQQVHDPAARPAQHTGVQQRRLKRAPQPPPRLVAPRKRLPAPIAAELPERRAQPERQDRRQQRIEQRVALHRVGDVLPQVAHSLSKSSSHEW